MTPRYLLTLAVLTHTLSSPAQDANKLAEARAAVPANTTAPAPIHASTPHVDDNYVIGPLDVLTVNVWKQEALSGTLLVRPDGMISMSLIGDVQASSFTPTQLGAQIAARLKKYFQDPNVTVVVSQIHSKVVYLLGEVGKKGPIDMAPGMTLLEAISMAGGTTEFANTKKMYILRNEGGKRSKIPVRYNDALKGNESRNVLLKPDDTIVVP
jgi:polysaccharide export outer membrane protein